MNESLQVILPALIALAATVWIHPYVLKVAKEKNIVDNPDWRKLQRTPVPIWGGLTVVFGIFAGMMAFSILGEFRGLFPAFAAMVIIWVVGAIDDIISLSPKVRFVVEILLILCLSYATGHQLNNFHGLWGLWAIPNYVSIPLTVFACVGIINAINLIDGVDGYSSGYSIVSCILFGSMFYALGNLQMVAFTAIVAASLMPFFFYNVFGKESKMFIGDAGTLSLGVIFSVFITTILSSQPEGTNFAPNIGLVPFTLAVLCIPVFDTLRVMSARMVRGKSPFNPDKTHLHHLFIELGYSHIGTALSIIGINLFVVLCWYLAYRHGWSIDAQLYLVVALGVLMTFVFYFFTKVQIRKETKIYRGLRVLAALTHAERKGFWFTLQKLADRSTDKEI